MKKQFFRVKQLADQTFSRAGKTEVLSDDLQAADKRVDFIKLACQNTSKKLSGSLQTQGQDATAREKRLKKNAEYLLGIAMLESGTCEEDCLLRQVVSECGKLEMCLANAYVDHEARVEANVLAGLQQVCDVDVPNIMKHKRNLAKLILDMDSARTRFQTATKHNSSSQANKLDSIKDDLEEAETKVEQCRDALACEMFQLISKEAELATTVLEYARLQRSYHQAALATLDEMIPELESTICDCSVKPVFGVSLEEHLRVTGRKIAYPIELCVCALTVLAMDEEGLFRVAGGASKIRRMKLSLDANCMSLATALEYRDPHVIASVLKSYLRQLPEPIMTHSLHDQWIAAAKVTSSNDARLQALWNVVQQLPTPNLDNLRYLVKFLALLSQNQEVNKMTPQNIAIVVAPNLLWSPNDDGTNIGVNMNTASLHSIILDSLVTYSDWFFPGDFNMFLTLSREQVVNGHSRSGSGETHLINTVDGIKRTQSNSSLSEDQSSPPQGSPKPMTRNRKNKPAPVPPANPPNKDPVTQGKDTTTQTQSRDIQTKSKDASVQSKDLPVQNKSSTLTPKETKNTSDESLNQSKISLSSNKDAKRSNDESLVQNKVISSSNKEARKISEESLVQNKVTPSSNKEARKSSDESLVQNKDTSSSTKQARKSCDESSLLPSAPAIENPPVLLGFEKFLNIEKQVNESERIEENKSEETFRREDGPERKIEKLHTEPETVIVNKNTESTQMSAVEPRGPAAELVYGTLERKRPPRPTPAPRTSLVPESGEKPQIPERPATLQRPLSSSFRHSRNLDTHSHTESDGPVSLERAHVYSVDKQQVSIIQVQGDKDSRNEKKESVEKPERPPKPELLTTFNPGHKRTASEGNIVDIGSANQKPGMNPGRPPRPTPPPPPTPKTRESTDL